MRGENKIKYLEGIIKNGIDQNLLNYISRNQAEAIANGMRGEESTYFWGIQKELQDTITAMPKTYETDGQGENAIAYLHYFNANSDWWITEKDCEEDQHQAFGLVSLNGQDKELGYISIFALIKMGVELDLHWTPKTIKEIKGKK